MELELKEVWLIVHGRGSGEVSGKDERKSRSVQIFPSRMETESLFSRGITLSAPTVHSQAELQ